MVCVRVYVYLCGANGGGTEGGGEGGADGVVENVFSSEMFPHMEQHCLF